MCSDSEKLYRAQFKYLSNPKDRSEKFDLMGWFHKQSAENLELIKSHRDQGSLYDISRMIELACWSTRVNIAHQMVCIL
jgi:hypothetical protein